MRPSCLFLLTLLASGATQAQLLPETTTAKYYDRAELTYRDQIRALAQRPDAERWPSSWPAGFVNLWRERRVGAGSVLRWTHINACAKPANPEHAAPCPGTYSLALELPAQDLKQADAPADATPPPRQVCTDQGELLGAVRIAGDAADGSQDCLGVLTQGCVRFEPGESQTLSLDLEFATASAGEPLKACANLTVRERISRTVAGSP